MLPVPACSQRSTRGSDGSLVYPRTLHFILRECVTVFEGKYCTVLLTHNRWPVTNPVCAWLAGGTGKILIIYVPVRKYQLGGLLFTRTMQKTIIILLRRMAG